MMCRNHSSTFAVDFLIYCCSPAAILGVPSSVKKPVSWKLHPHQHRMLILQYLLPRTAGVARSQHLPPWGIKCQNSTTISCCHSRRKCYDLSPPALEGKKKKQGELPLLPTRYVNHLTAICACCRPECFYPQPTCKLQGPSPSYAKSTRESMKLPAGTETRLCNYKWWWNCNNPLWSPQSVGKSRKGPLATF